MLSIHGMMFVTLHLVSFIRYYCTQPDLFPSNTVQWTDYYGVKIHSLSNQSIFWACRKGYDELFNL